MIAKSPDKPGFFVVWLIAEQILKMIGGGYQKGAC